MHMLLLDSDDSSEMDNEQKEKSNTSNNSAQKLNLTKASLNQTQTSKENFVREPIDTKPNFEELDKSFNTKEITKALETNLRKTEEERQLPAVDMSEEEKDALHAKQQEEDLQYARMMLKQAEAFNAEAIEGILHIARNSDQPRAYEVAGGLIKNLQDNAKDMLDVHEKQKRITADDSKGKQIKTQNNMFVGSTKDLLQALKGEQAKTIEGEIAEDDGTT